MVDCRSASAASRRDQRLLERLRLLAVLARLLLGVGQKLVRLFLGFEKGFLLAGFGVALGVLDDAEGLFLGAADGFGGDALAVRDPDREQAAAATRVIRTLTRYPRYGNTRDVLSACVPRGLRSARDHQENREENGDERPRFAVWGGR